MKDMMDELTSEAALRIANKLRIELSKLNQDLSRLPLGGRGESLYRIKRVREMIRKYDKIASWEA